MSFVFARDDTAQYIFSSRQDAHYQFRHFQLRSGQHFRSFEQSVDANFSFNGVILSKKTEDHASLDTKKDAFIEQHSKSVYQQQTLKLQ